MIRTALARLFPAVAVIFALLASAPAFAARPRLTPEQLRQAAGRILDGVVTAIYTDFDGNRMRYILEFRIARVEKGSATVGDSILVRSESVTNALPMTVGDQGHDTVPRRVGATTRVYLQGDTALAPNGWTDAEPLFATGQLLESKDLSTLDAAFKEAAKARAGVEAERIARRMLELDPASADAQLNLAGAIASQRRFKDAAAVAEAVAFPKPGQPDAGPEARERAMMGYAMLTWAAEDRPAYVAAMRRRAEALNTLEAWTDALDAAEWCRDAAARKLAAEKITALGGDPDSRSRPIPRK
ncbi:MAG: hypothetical protein IBJ11_07700 [Phycisphaerales bacterium]|nr:hypothetical protein [Phycisphaerales bacterium]